MDLIITLAAQKEMETLSGTSFRVSETVSFIQREKKTNKKNPVFFFFFFPSNTADVYKLYLAVKVPVKIT